MMQCGISGIYNYTGKARGIYQWYSIWCPMYLHSVCRGVTSICLSLIWWMFEQLVRNIILSLCGCIYWEGLFCLYCTQCIENISTGCIYRRMEVASKKLIVCQRSHLGGKKDLNSTSSTTNTKNQNPNTAIAIILISILTMANDHQQRLAFWRSIFG